MASGTQTSRVLSKIKKTAAPKWNAARSKAPVVKGARLPGNILGGVAQLTSAKWGETDDKKTPYLALTYVVREPDEHAGMKQSVSYFFADSKFKTIQDVIDELASDLQLMGVDTEGMDFDDVPAHVDQLVAEEIPIIFNTREGETDSKPPRKWFKFDLQGVADDYTPPEPTATVEDDDTTEADEGSDVTAEEDDPADPDAGDWEPQPEEVYFYKPNPKSKKTEVEVVDVDAAAQTATVKRLTDNKVFKAVAWDKLEGDE